MDQYTTLSDDIKPFIGTLAISDAKHDKLVKGDNEYKVMLEKGLPNGDLYLFKSEHDVFNSLFQNDLNQTILDGKLNKAEGYISGGAKYTLEHLKQRQGLDCHIGIGDGIKPYQVYNIPVKKQWLSNYGKRHFIKDDEKSPLYSETTSTITFASFLSSKIKTNTEINFIVDFNQCGFLDMVLNDSKNNVEDINFEPKINYLMTPEVLNDPAGKTNLQDNLFKNPTIYNPLLEIDGYARTYLSFKGEGEDPLENNFYSLFNISLNSIKKQENSKSTKLVGNGSISWGDKNENGLYEFSSEDGSNSNTKTKSRIFSLFKYLTGRGKNKVMDIFSYNAQIQHKRSGDWLQALACGLVDGRRFRNIRDNIDIVMGSNITYFVSHDINAVTYALLLGINVIFLTNDLKGGVLVFNNQKNPNFAQVDETQLINRRIKGMQEYLNNNWYPQYTQRREQRQTTRYGHDTWGTNYMEALELLKEQYRTQITEQFNKNEQIINNDIPLNQQIQQIKNISDGLSKYFQLLVEFAFVNKSFPELRNEFDILDLGANQSINQVNDIANLQLKINAYSKIISTRALFGFDEEMSNDQDLLLEQAFVKFIRNNLYKLDVYLSVATSFEISSLPDKSRNPYIKSVFGSTNLETNSKISDISSFIAYLNELDMTYIRDIYNISTLLINKYNNEELSSYIEGLRKPKQEPYKEYINIINTLNECVKILPEPPQSDNNQDNQEDLVNKLEQELQSDNRSSPAIITSNNTNIIQVLNNSDSWLANNDSTTLPDSSVTSNIAEEEIGLHTKDAETGEELTETEQEEQAKKVTPNRYYTRYLKSTLTNGGTEHFFRNNWMNSIRSSVGLRRQNGGKLGSVGVQDNRRIKHEDEVVLDICQTRIYWPLLFYSSNVNLYNNESDIISYLLNLVSSGSIEHYVVSPLVSLIPKLSNTDNQYNELRDKLTRGIDEETVTTQYGENTVMTVRRRIELDQQGDAFSVLVLVIWILYYIKPMVYGGSDTPPPPELSTPLENQLDDKRNDSKEKFNFKKAFGCHPLLPLYNILTSYWYNISEKMVISPDFVYFNQYYKFLNKCFNVLNEKYLQEGNHLNILKAYIISKGLQTLFFSVSTNIDLSNKFEELINMNYEGSETEESKPPETEESKPPETEESKSPEIEESKSPETEESKSPETEESKSPETEESKSPETEESKSSETEEERKEKSEIDILLFTMINGIYSNYFCGTVKLSEEENNIAQIYINNPLFNNFINNEVDIKKILIQSEEESMNLSIDIENSDKIEKTMKQLQEDVFNDIAEITKIIGEDIGEENMSPNEENMSPNEEIMSPNEEIMSPNEENMSANEENMSANKESMSPNKEIMSPNKEIMSPNEESMSPNEESMSPNEESMSPNEELNKNVIIKKPLSAPTIYKRSPNRLSPSMKYPVQPRSHGGKGRTKKKNNKRKRKNSKKKQSKKKVKKTKKNKKKKKNSKTKRKK